MTKEGAEYDAYALPFGEIPAPIPSERRFPQNYFSQPELFVSQELSVVRGLNLENEPIVSVPANRNKIDWKKLSISAAGIIGSVAISTLIIREQHKSRN